jgi:hypothetical protein
MECKSYTILTHNTPFLGGNATFMLTKKQKRTEKNQAPSPGKTLFLVVHQSGVCKRHLKGTAYMNTRRQEWSFQLNHWVAVWGPSKCMMHYAGLESHKESTCFKKHWGVWWISLSKCTKNLLGYVLQLRALISPYNARLRKWVGLPSSHPPFPLHRETN